jgi:hypothetical protein
MTESGIVQRDDRAAGSTGGLVFGAAGRARRGSGASHRPRGRGRPFLEDVADARQLFEHGTMEERKRVIRAFVEGLTIDGASQSGEIRMKKLPAPEMSSTGSSFDLVAEARHEAIHDALVGWLSREHALPRNGRRSPRAAVPSPDS